MLGTFCPCVLYGQTMEEVGIGKCWSCVLSLLVVVHIAPMVCDYRWATFRLLPHPPLSHTTLRRVNALPCNITDLHMRHALRVDSIFP